MTVKTSGLLFKEWYNDINEWPADAYHEDEKIVVNGIEGSCDFDSIPGDAVVSLSGGCIYYDKVDVCMEWALRRWLKKKSREESFDRILVEIPRGTREAFVSHVKSIGGKVI